MRNYSSWLKPAYENINAIGGRLSLFIAMIIWCHMKYPTYHVHIVYTTECPLTFIRLSTNTLILYDSRQLFVIYVWTPRVVASTRYGIRNLYFKIIVSWAVVKFKVVCCYYQTNSVYHNFLCKRRSPYILNFELIFEVFAWPWVIVWLAF